MKLPVILVTLAFLFASCGGNYCPPSTTSNWVIKPIIKGYFPYQAGDKIKFTRYIDTVKTGEIVLIVDTSSFIDNRRNEKDCAGGSLHVNFLNIEHKLFTLNQTETDKDWVIEIIGRYDKEEVSKIDITELVVKLYDSDITCYDFGDAVVHGSVYYSVDSIFINNKNYGPGMCIQPNYPTRIYFNQTYGILKYVNDTKKEQILYTE